MQHVHFIVPKSNIISHRNVNQMQFVLLLYRYFPLLLLLLEVEIYTLFKNRQKHPLYPIQIITAPAHPSKKTPSPET